MIDNPTFRRKILNHKRAEELGVWMNDDVLCIDATRGAFFHKMTTEEAISYLTKERIIKNK